MRQRASRLCSAWFRPSLANGLTTAHPNGAGAGRALRRVRQGDEIDEDRRVAEDYCRQVANLGREARLHAAPPEPGTRAGEARGGDFKKAKKKSKKQKELTERATRGSSSLGSVCHCTGHPLANGSCRGYPARVLQSSQTVRSLTVTSSSAILMPTLGRHGGTSAMPVR
jgi:hypothetical protein